MERPLVIKGCDDCDPFADPYYKAIRYERGDYIRHNVEAVALIVKGGLYKIKDVLSIYPEYISPEQLCRNGIIRGPPNDVVTIVESVCCIKPRAVGKDLIYATTKPLRLTIKFSKVNIHYVVDGDVYKRTWKVVKQWSVDLRLKPLSERLIDFIASEKYLLNMFPIEPPDTVVVRAEDGSFIYITFGGERPQVKVDMSKTPSLLWFAKKPEEVLKGLLS